MSIEIKVPVLGESVVEATVSRWLKGKGEAVAADEAVVELERELTEAGADWQIHVYGNACHAFTNPLANDPDFGTVYDSNADKRSWQTLLNFLDELF